MTDGFPGPRQTVAQRAKAEIKKALGLHGIKRVKVLAGPARGISMTLDFTGQTPLYLGMYEWELHRFIRYATEGAGLIFDVGGFIGYDALAFAANSPGQVVTFEPDDESRARLAENLEQNPELAGRLVVSPLAVGRAIGAGVTTLDEAADQFGAPDFVKIDIEGAEADALRGGLEVLRTNRPHLLIETHSLELEQECGLILAECGYRPVIKHNRTVWREPRGNLPVNRWLLASGYDRTPVTVPARD